MRERLGLVLGPAERLDPLGGQAMLLRPAPAGNLTVGHLADEQVPERVLALGGDGRAPLPADELTPFQSVQQRFHAVRIAAAERSDGPGPEDLAEYGCVLEHLLLLARQGVEACRDDALDGLRQLLGQRSALLDHARELLGVERVAAGPPEQGHLQLGW